VLRVFTVVIDIVIEDVARIKQVITELLNKLNELCIEKSNIGGSVVLATDTTLIEITIPVPSIEPRLGVPYIPKHIVRVRISSTTPIEIVRACRIIDEVCKKIPGVRASLTEKG